MNNSKEEYAHPEYLVETKWLEQNLKAPNLRVFDCTVNVLRNPDSDQSRKIPFIYGNGLENFSQSHIPGAGYIDVSGELSDSSSELPLMLPNDTQIIEAMRNYGVSDDSHVVLYSATEPNWAARVWWMLRSVGFNNVAILNGGWAKWKSEKRATSQQACDYPLGNLSLHQHIDSFVGKNEVLKSIQNHDIRIINALPAGMYDGSSEFVFGRKGRIPNSVNIPFVSLHEAATGSYLSAYQLRNNFDQVNVSDAKHIIAYCGGGIAASNNAFALVLLGYENISVYDGSMLEWGNDPSLPMELDNDL